VAVHPVSCTPSASVTISNAEGSCLGGSKTAGESCQGAEDCAPTCCVCPGDAGAFAAASCVNGLCLGGNEACARSLPADAGGSVTICG